MAYGCIWHMASLLVFRLRFTGLWSNNEYRKSTPHKNEELNLFACSSHVFPGSSTMYLETTLQLPDIVATGRFVPNKQGTGFPASYASLPEGTTLGFQFWKSSNLRHRTHTVVRNALEFSIQLSEFPLLNHWKRWQPLQWRPGGGFSQ